MVNCFPLLGLWLALVAQRLGELRLSKAHTQELRNRGAREYGSGHYPAMVLLHSCWFLCWLVEGYRAGCAVNPFWRWLLLAAIVCQMIRFATMQALGERWTTRVLVIPGIPPVRSGIYRFLAHPNYLAVAVEIACVPLIFWAWRTALLFSLGNLILLKTRVRVENEALGL